MENLIFSLTEEEQILCLTGQEVLLTSVDLPNVKPQKALQALPFAIEEELIDDLEHYHISLCHRDETIYHVAVIDKKTLQKNLQPYLEDHYRVIRAIPMVLIFPWQPETWTVVRAENLVWLRCALYEGYCIEADNFNLLLQLKIAELKEKPKQIHCYTCANVSTKLTLQNHGIDWQEQQITLPFNEYLAECLNAEALPSCNLLQGEFTPKRRSHATKKQWRFAGGMVAATVLLSIFTKLYEHHFLKTQVQSLDQQVLSLYQEVFPGARVAASPRIVIKRELDKLGGHTGAPFFHLLSVLSQEIQHTSNEVAIENLIYSHGKMVTNLTFNDASTLENFSGLLKEQGVNVQQDSAMSKEDKVLARLIIEGG